MYQVYQLNQYTELQQSTITNFESVVTSVKLRIHAKNIGRFKSAVINMSKQGKHDRDELDALC